MRPEFKPEEVFASASTGYQLLPFRFTRLPDVPDRILLTSEVGEHLFLAEGDFHAFVDGRLRRSSPCYTDLLARHFLYEGSPQLATRLLAAKYRTRKSFLRGGPALHLFVVTLRCDHSCHYCQVSRQSADRMRFDMSLETAQSAIDRLFETPSSTLTVEFQGGEPLLAFSVIREIVEEIVRRNVAENRNIVFSMTSTLHHLTDEILDFLAAHNFQISTSIDGPAALHDVNRPSPTRDSHTKTLAGLERARQVLGFESVTALTTLTRRSLESPEEIIDEYVRLGFRSIFLRPLSPYGFAVRSRGKIGYGTADFIRFYKRALFHLLRLNSEGVPISEAYTSILLGSILTPFPSTYTDLRSPTGAMLGAIAYNYDGGVYASDESRMLAEMNDHSLRLGHVSQPYRELIASPAGQLLLASGIAESLPGCSDCAFLSYCGADPVHMLATQGDPVGHRAFSDHCHRHMAMLEVLFSYLAAQDDEVMRTFLAWVTGRTAQELDHRRECA